MIKIAKHQNPPQLFTQWVDENQQSINKWIADSKKSGDNLWEEFGKTFGEPTNTTISDIDVRYYLELHLYNEQHGLCCYCGNRIERYFDESKKRFVFKNRAIEHFIPKNFDKNLVFSYTNLLHTCKESSKLTKYIIGQKYHSQEVLTFQDIADLCGLQPDVIKKHNTSLLRKNVLQKGDVVLIPNPPHCDDAKSKFDSQPKQITIINPTKNYDIIDSLTYNEKGELENKNNEPIIADTITVLNLNCNTLTERRKETWINAYTNYYDENTGILFLMMKDIIANKIEDSETIKMMLLQRINRLITQKSMPNNENLLDPFYFVEISFLQSLFTRTSK